MPVKDQTITEHYALFNGNCVEVMQNFPANALHFSAYSPPFCGLYVYSSDPHDLSNCVSYDEFMEHYAYVVEQVHRVTMPGRCSAVHCMDVPTSNTGHDHLRDFPGDIIRLHDTLGFRYVARYHVWKEPLAVRNRTMAKNLAHKTIVDDGTLCSVASADYLLVFRKDGTNPVPVAHPHGLDYYAGARIMPADIQAYRGWTGNQIENKYSHWIWRQYASAFWDDIRLDRVLPYVEASEEDERHIHPLQLDVIERCLILWTNPGEKVLSPFAGVGSEVYGAVILGRKGVGIELKSSYYRQAVKNLEHAAQHSVNEQTDLFAGVASSNSDDLFTSGTTD